MSEATNQTGDGSGPAPRRRLVRMPPARQPVPGPFAPPPADGDEAEGGPGRLLRVAASCPRCGARPAMRVTDAMVRALLGAESSARVGTYQCQRRGCGAIYDLVAAAYQRAS